MLADRLFKDYELQHQTPGNRLCHSFGIPFVVLSILGILSHWVIAAPATTIGPTLLRLDGGIILWVAFLLVDLLLDWRLGLPFSLFTLGAYFLARTVPPTGLVTLFICGWLVQFIGHIHFEKNSPAFFKNLLHLWIGPLWFFSKMIGYSR